MQHHHQMAQWIEVRFGVKTQTADIVQHTTRNNNKRLEQYAAIGDANIATKAGLLSASETNHKSGKNKSQQMPLYIALIMNRFLLVQ